MRPNMVVLVVAIAATSRSATAQTGREALRAGVQAHEVADFETAARLLSRGLDPNAGPRDSVWLLGIHKLVDALNDQGRTALAETWVRWALRQATDLAVDTVNFPPAVRGVFQRAREAVVETTLDPAVVRTTWQWAANGDADRPGVVRIRDADAGVSIRIDGGPSLVAGQDQQLAAGSYTILASADGYLPARGALEVLPAVTTILDVHLAPVRPGFLSVNAAPWAQVLLDGAEIGYTLLSTHPVPVGEHVVRLLRDGYLPFDTTITVASDQHVRLGTVHMRRSP